MLISIVTTAYNSSEYIERTVIAVLNQELKGFDIQYVISDDGSFDNTVEIISKIKLAHPKGNKIDLISHPKNVGVVKNFFNAIDHCRGAYIAFCDSDDIWMDREKLTKQYEFMSTNPDCVLTYHRLIDVKKNDLHLILNNSDLKVKNIITPHTSTLLIKNKTFQIPWPLIDRMLRMNDQLLRYLIKDQGKFIYLPHIEPNIRVIRENTVFASTRSDLDRYSSSLYNWTCIYDHFRTEDKNHYLQNKVREFQSKVKWAEYHDSKNLNTFLKSLRFDIFNKIILKRLSRSTRKILFSPYRAFKYRQS